jgi:hypothetical protein
MFTRTTPRGAAGTTTSALVTTTRAGRGFLTAVELAADVTSPRQKRLAALTVAECLAHKPARWRRRVEPSVVSAPVGRPLLSNPAYALFVSAVLLVDDSSAQDAAVEDMQRAASAVRRSLGG